ncbi:MULTISPECIES: tetratricopeptide repeat protein [unclassified Myroides]|uniref:tetratricopeptide repeat protein n=1 Tax=unclassified Myroides TaxID=2642485 RepID=UPI003D2F9B4A
MKFKLYNELSLLLLIGSGTQCLAQTSPTYSIDELSCPTTNEEIVALYKMGFSALEQTEYYNTAGRIFFQIIQKDKELCDAYYYTGVALTKQDKDNAAYTYLYYADSLAIQPTLTFKVALAESALRIDNIGLARKKYEEIKQYFPDSPEGYFGLSLTATSLGDIVEGLVNTDRTLAKYKNTGLLTEQREQEIYFIKAILLRMNAQYDKAISFFEKSKPYFGTTTDFLANYALATYELYKQTKEAKWKIESQQALAQIQDKSTLKDDFIHQFNYDD